MATGDPRPAEGFFARRAARRMAEADFPLQRPLRVLTASAKVVNTQDKAEARRLRSVRQGWQSEAWTYRDSIGEIRFASRFMAHCVGRMRVFPAAYPSSDFGEDPISLVDIDGVPPEVVASANAAMNALGAGRLSMSQILESMAENFFVAGECNMVSRSDPATGEDRFRIASVDEVVVKDDAWWLRELPQGGQTSDQSSWYELTDDDYLARLWCPHPRFAALADSSLRALSEECEELLILSRMIRASGRSRLAGAGVLLVPDELSLASTTEDNEDAEADDFMGALTTAMMEPIGDEGAASAVVPIIMQGPNDMLANVRHLLFDRPIDPVMAAQRQELIARIAIGLDLPSEVLTGKADLNHWTAWNVDDNTFRHHVEPSVIAVVDALTVGYLRNSMLADGCDPAWVNRVVLWYDATDLVVHPDRSADAMLLHERLVISDDALRDACGYTEQDAPTVDEIWMRSLRTTRSWPPNIIESMLHAYAPELKIYPDKNEPGINPDGTTVSIAPDAGPAPAVGPASTTQGPPSPTVDTGPTSPNQGPPLQASALEVIEAVTAALSASHGRPPELDVIIAAASAGPSPQAVRLSRRLVDIDRDLRTRLQVLANAAVRQVLSRSGARLRTKVAASKDETMKAKIDHRPNEQLAAIIGEPATAALGLTASSLVATDWSDIEPQFHAWVKSAQLSAIQTACKLARIDPSGPKVAAITALYEDARIKAWRAFTSALDSITADLLYRPTIRASAEEPWGDLDPNSLVPAGLVRDTLSIAGGADPGTLMQGMDDRSSTNEDAVGQIGTGSAVSDLLSGEGAQVMSYEWIHGPAVHPFDPHAELDGLTFATFDDDSLLNAEDFPEASYYTPGDHVGCTCDFMPTWDIPGVEAANADQPVVEGMVDYAGERTPTGPAEGRGGADFIPGHGIFDYGDPAARAALPELAADTTEAAAEVLATAPTAEALSANVETLTADVNKADLKAAQQEIMPLVRSSADAAERNLENMGVRAIARPARGDASGEYDWLRSLSSDERSRLTNNGWLTSDPFASAPDQVVAGFKDAAGGANSSVDKAMGYWLDQTRIIDAARLLENTGRLPANLDRFGSFNWTQLSDGHLDVAQLFAVQRDALAYLSDAEKEASYEFAQRELAASYGPPIYEMPYDTWRTEVARLGDIVNNAVPISTDAEWGDTYSAAVNAAFMRLEELTPLTLCNADGSYTAQALWLEARTIAVNAGLAS